MNCKLHSENRRTELRQMRRGRVRKMRKTDGKHGGLLREMRI